MDCMGPLPLTEKRNKYILSCQDQLSKYLISIAIPNQEAETIARVLVDNVITVFGSPGSILTDCASNFTGEIMRHLCRLLKISKIKTTPFRPQSNASIERSHAVLTEYLRHFICKEQNNWDTCCQQQLSSIIQLPIHKLSIVHLSWFSDGNHPYQDCNNAVLTILITVRETTL
jgi:transposase InsO family protein